MSLLGAAETTSKEREPDKESASERALDQKLRESRTVFFWLNVFLKMSGGHARQKNTQLLLCICMCVYKY